MNNLPDAELDELERLEKAAGPQEDYAKGRTQVYHTPEHKDEHGVYNAAALWYDDGDQCAEVHGNLGLGIDGTAMAEYIAALLNAAPRLLPELRRSRAILDAMRRGWSVMPAGISDDDGYPMLSIGRPDGTMEADDTYTDFDAACDAMVEAAKGGDHE